MIKAVAFDLWETLITENRDRSREQAQLRLANLERVLVERGYVATAEAIDRAYRELWQQCHELYWRHDLDVSCRRQIEHFLESLQLDPRAFDEPALAALEQAYAYAAVELPPD